jgi:hypothetical protein
MSINYSFTIDNVRKKNVIETSDSGNLSDVIINADYTAKAWSGDTVSDSLGGIGGYEYYYELTSTVEFNSSELDSSTFTPFDQITKQVVLSWIVDIEDCGSIQNHRDVVLCLDQVREQIYHASNETVATLPGDSFTESTTETSWSPPVKETPAVEEEVEEDPNEGIRDPMEDTLDSDMPTE